MQDQQQQQPTPGRAEIPIWAEHCEHAGQPSAVSLDRCDGEDCYVCSFDRADTEGEETHANANIIAEAFNVHHETGATPRQMQALIGDLLGALERGLADDLDGHARDEAQDAVAKARGEMRIETPRQIQQQREELRSLLSEAAERLAESGHTEDLCGTVTTLSNGQPFHEGCSCGLDDLIERCNQALTTTRPTQETP